MTSLHSRLATSLDAADVLAVTDSVCGGACPSSTPGGREDAVAGPAGDGLPRASPRSLCPALVLMGFCGGMLEVIGDCEDGFRQGSAETSGGAGPGTCGDAGVLADAHGAVLRSALTTLALFLDGPKATPSAANPESGRAGEAAGDGPLPARVARDEFSKDAVNVFSGSQERARESPVSRESDATGAAPVRQLVALRFLHQAMRRWPRLTAKLMHAAGLWSVIFSGTFLAGGSHHVARAIESLDESTAQAGSAGGGTNYGTVGWGIVHDGSLLLLEAAVIVRCFLQLGPEGPGSERQAQGRSHADGDQGSGPAGSSEIVQFVSFLARGREGGGRPLAIPTIQGCRWLKAVVAMEPAVGAGLLPPSSRVRALRLALQSCERGNGAGADARAPGRSAWPLVHTSLSLAVALASSNSEPSGGELLFQAAVAFALDVDMAAGALGPAPAKSRAHGPTASMTSEASSPGVQATNSWWNSGSGGSRTPVSVNSVSPRGGPSFSFGDTPAAPPPPRPPRPLAEVLFKAALDPRARRVVFYFTVLLGMEASRQALALLDVHRRRGGGGDPDLFFGDESSSGVQDMATAVLSGLVEGFLCLCERAAAATVAGPAATDDGPRLLLDALYGACALMRSEVPRGGVSGGASSSSGGGDDIQGGSMGARPSPPSMTARVGRVGDTRGLPLLQEVFREHGASSRLLVVLESVVGSPVASSTSPSASAAETCPDILAASLSLLTALMAGNSLGKRAFRRALSEHYEGKDSRSGVAPPPQPPAGVAYRRLSFMALSGLVSAMPPAPLCRALVEMLMDGEVPECVLEVTQGDEEGGDDGVMSGFSGRGKTGVEGGLRGGGGAERTEPSSSPPEIRNPFVVPLLFRLLPDWPVAEQEIAMRVFRLLLTGAGGGVVNRSLCSDVQPALMDQVWLRPAQ